MENEEFLFFAVYVEAYNHWISGIRKVFQRMLHFPWFVVWGEEIPIIPKQFEVEFGRIGKQFAPVFHLKEVFASDEEPTAYPEGDPTWKSTSTKWDVNYSGLLIQV